MTIRVINKEPHRPSFGVYDLEWYPGSLQLRMVGFFDGDRYVDFPGKDEKHGAKGIDDFLDHVLTREYAGWWFFAHFGGAADFCFLIESLRQRGLQVEARFSGSAAVYVEVSRNRFERWVFVDSFFLIRAPLRDIGKKLGMKKGGAEGSTEVFSRPYPELRDYNEDDCRILYRAINEFALTLYEMGGELKPTAASCGMSLFRRRYLRSNIKTNDLFNVRLRESYVASRVEDIRGHGERLVQYDINSSFPYSMTYAHPGKYLSSRDTVKDSDTMFFVDCEVEIDESLHIPPLPYRIDGKVFFPVGNLGRRWLTGVDFRLAEKMGRVLRVHNVMLYEERFDLRDYVQDIYARRKAATGFEKDVYKILMNGLYGKTAEGNLKDSIVLNPRDRQILAKRNPDGSPIARELFPGCLKVTEYKKIHHQHVPIAAWVTALSRQWITEYLIADGDPYYVDTDCIVTTNTTLPTSEELGGLKIEAMVDKGYFYAPKFYYLEGVTVPGQDEKKEKVRAKGFSRITLDGFRYLVSGELAEGVEFADNAAKPCSIRVGGRGQPALAVERMSRPKEILNRFARENLRYQGGIGPSPGSAEPTSSIIPKTVYFEVSKRNRHDARGEELPEGRTVPYHTRQLLEMFGGA